MQKKFYIKILAWKIFFYTKNSLEKFQLKIFSEKFHSQKIKLFHVEHFWSAKKVSHKNSRLKNIFLHKKFTRKKFHLKIFSKNYTRKKLKLFHVEHFRIVKKFHIKKVSKNFWITKKFHIKKFFRLQKKFCTKKSTRKKLKLFHVEHFWIVKKVSNKKISNCEKKFCTKNFTQKKMT